MSGSQKRLVLLGPPGAGKGTQADALAVTFGIPHISTGNLFRENLAASTALGLEARQYMDAGRLVPDAVTQAMVAARLDQPDAQSGAVFDGFPRTLPQAEALKQILAGRGWRLTRALSLEVPRPTLIERLTGRRVCSVCQASYHVVHQPPRVEGVCDRCGGALIQRRDDEPATVEERLRVYEQETAPLLDVYQREGLLTKVPAVGPVDEVTSRLLAALEASHG